MLTSIADLINLWPEPRVANFAKDIQVTTEHAAAMKRRNSVPARHWETLVANAERRGIELSLEMLAALAARRQNSEAA